MSTFNLAKRIKVVNANANIDADYGPYNSLAEANTAIILALRRPGKTVGIMVDGSVIEYCWRADTTNSGLVVKTPSATLGQPVIVNGVTIGDITDGYVFPATDTLFDVTRKTYNRTLAPTYTNPGINLIDTTGQSGLHEVGQSLSLALQLDYTRNDAGPTTQMTIADSGPLSIASSLISNIPNQFSYNNPNNPNTLYQVNHTIDIHVPSGTLNYQGSVQYGTGNAKQNNQNVIDMRNYAVRNSNAPQLPDLNYTSNIISVVGIFPYFWATSSTIITAANVVNSIQSGGAQKVLGYSNNTITINFNTSGSQYLWFAVPSDSIKTKWFVDTLNKGNIGTSSDLFNAKTTASVTTLLWNNINYDIYITNYDTIITSPMQLQN